MDDKKRNITGSYPGAGGVSRPKSNGNPAGSYPGRKPAASEPTRVIPAEPTVVIPKIDQTKVMPKVEPKVMPEQPVEKAPEMAAEAPDQKKKFKFSTLFTKETMQKYWKTMAYYSCILLVSVLLSCWICDVGNEVLGLIRPEKEVTVTIPEKSSLRGISKELKKADVIDHPVIFRLYCRLKGAGSNFQSGEYTIDCSGDYNQLIRALRRTAGNKTMVEFKIEAGDTQEDVVTTLCESLGYLERKELEAVLQDYDFSDYSFLKNLPERNYRLEGYLYPGTYEMYEGESALAVVKRILSRFEEKVLTEENNKKIKASDYSLDELITLASILEKEGGKKLAHAAGVYYNRLESKDFPYLESQATVAYILPAGQGAITGTDIKTSDPYNTYRNQGLTPGPIANPGADAVAAVLEPKVTNDFYFVTQSNGEMLFAETSSQQKINLNKAGADARGTGTVT